ncbi:MAG: LytTR family DNA-binding domain-containing protein [Gemmatimonadaceae bacterium]|nr:LytTR family DNA-binding domain-containing protein [Gemmatimonadaceae bacterium]
MIALLVEDERPAQRRLQRLLLAHPACAAAEVIPADDLDTARTVLATRAVDLLLLDLDVRGDDGFALLAEPATARARVIVVSAMESRAIEAFRHGVVDFVPKPVTEARLMLALGRALQAVPDPRVRELVIRTRHGAELVRAHEIVALEGAGDYVDVRLRDGRRLLHDEPLVHLERMLPDGFVRVHRSHIVPREAIWRVHTQPGGGRELELVDGSRVPVSRRRAAAVLRQLNRGRAR